MRAWTDKAIWMTSTLLIAACGGGGGGGSPPDDSGIGSDSGWIEGVFMPAATFADLCEAPRSGVDPATGNPYPDLQGLTLDENNWLRSYSHDTYLWYDEIDDVDPGLWSSPLAYFDRLRTFETTASGTPKDQFHFTYATDEYRALAQSGVAVGYGATFAVTPTSPPELVIAYTEPDTPATAAGLGRGTRILGINGTTLATASPSELDIAFEALFPDEEGETHLFEVLEPGALASQGVELTAATITSAPVPTVDVVTSEAGATVGYLLFNEHIATAEQALIDAIDTLSAVPGGIDDLVLDIRYNGGGFLAIASQLGYMIGGGATAGRTFERIEFNDKHPTTDPVTGEPIEPMPFIDVTLGFSAPSTSPPTPLPSLELSRVFVLTGESTCSASEAIINGLRGAGVEVIQIGGTTCGKPYGFYPTDNCGTTYFTIQFRGVNDAGFGDYADGFSPSGGTAGTNTTPPGCVVADDFDRALGDPAEAQLAGALQYRDTLSCPMPAAAGMSKTFPEPAAVPTWSVVKRAVLTNRLLEP